ncbi:MAG: diguanylate cyclase, partial [Clostridia bacterium]|nr:diguanylate cyclase [Clostridia bacterium]
MTQIWLPLLVILAVLAAWALVMTVLYLVSKKRTRQMERRYESLCHLSQTDPLTGLPNRTALLARSADRQPQTQPGQAESAIFIDFDNFRVVNEALGHVAGDRILKELALALVQVLQGKGEVYRIGGDEFLIILKAERLEELEAIARSAQQILARQVTINQRSFYLTTSIGIHEALPGDTLEDSLRKADIALFFAKKLRNNILVYSPRMESSRTRDTILSEDLPAALDHHQFELTWQPIVTATDGRPFVIEAKAVWHHPEFGSIFA